MIYFARNWTIHLPDWSITEPVPNLLGEKRMDHTQYEVRCPVCRKSLALESTADAEGWYPSECEKGHRFMCRPLSLTFAEGVFEYKVLGESVGSKREGIIASSC